MNKYTRPPSHKLLCKKFLKNAKNVEKHLSNVCHHKHWDTAFTKTIQHYRKSRTLFGKTAFVACLFFWDKVLSTIFKLNFLRNIIKLIFVLLKSVLFLFCCLLFKCVEIFKCVMFCRDILFAIRHSQNKFMENMLGSNNGSIN